MNGLKETELFGVKDADGRMQGSTYHMERNSVFLSRESCTFLLADYVVAAITGLNTERKTTQERTRG